MHARMITARMKPGQLDEAVQTYASSIVPAMRAQAGFREAKLLIDAAESSAVSITFWETEEAMLHGEASGYLQEQITKLGEYFAEAPDSAHYAVAVRAAAVASPPEDRSVDIFFDPAVAVRADQLSQRLTQLGVAHRSEDWLHARETGDGPLHVYAGIDTSTIYYGSGGEYDALALQAVLAGLDPALQADVKAGPVANEGSTWHVGPRAVRVLLIAAG